MKRIKIDPAAEGFKTVKEENALESFLYSFGKEPDYLAHILGISLGSAVIILNILSNALGGTFNIKDQVFLTLTQLDKIKPAPRYRKPFKWGHFILQAKEMDFVGDKNGWWCKIIGYNKGRKK